MPKVKSSPEPETAEHPDGYRLLVAYTSSLHTPPDHTVVLRTSQSDWDDVPMTWSGDAWRTELCSAKDDGPVDIEFKFVLDGGRWMTGSNQHGRTDLPAAVLDYDDASVQFDQ